MSTLLTTNLKNTSSVNNNIVLGTDGSTSLISIGGSCIANVGNITGINTTGVTTSGSAAVTLTGTGVASSISNGDYVTGLAVTPGTVVSSGAGTANLVLSSNVGVTSSTNALTFYSTTKVVTPAAIGGQLCRAWVNFNGLSATIVPRAAYNVSSITDGGLGIYTVNFTTAMPDANYSTSVNIDSSPNSSGFALLGNFGSASNNTTSSFKIVTTNTAFNYTDYPLITASVFR